MKLPNKKQLHQPGHQHGQLGLVLETNERTTLLKSECNCPAKNSSTSQVAGMDVWVLSCNKPATIFCLCIWILPVMVSKPEECSPLQSLLSSPYHGGSPTASPSFLPPAATSGIRECSGLGSVEKMYSGVWGPVPLGQPSVWEITREIIMLLKSECRWPAKNSHQPGRSSAL